MKRFYKVFSLPVAFALLIGALLFFKPAASAADISVSDFSGLQAAVNSAAGQDVIIVSQDIHFAYGETLEIPAGKNIGITSAAGQNFTLTSNWSNQRHINNSGTLMLYNITLTGGEIGGGINNYGSLTLNEGALVKNCKTTDANSAAAKMFSSLLPGGGAPNQSRVALNDSAAVQELLQTLAALSGYGGGIYNEGYLTLNEGSLVQNCEAGVGGGIANYLDSAFYMYGGEITANTAGSGGGVACLISSFTMEGGEIYLNSAENGGAVMCLAAALSMAGGEIHSNTAELGGGVYFLGGFYEAFFMEGGNISGNTAAYGGGVYFIAGFDIPCEIWGGNISGNTANHDGGGIFVEYAGLPLLSVGPNALFANNRAGKAFVRNNADDELYGRMIKGTAWTFPFDQGYNNYDIAYNKGEEIPASYFTYAQSFPDAKFCAEVLRLLNEDGKKRTDSSVITVNDVNALASFTILDVSGLDISDMTGLKYFCGLQLLNCYYNQLSALDVSGNSELQYLYCNNNQLSVLDISGNSALQFLLCYNNQLSALDVAKNTALWYLSCYDNYIAAPDSVAGWREIGLVINSPQDLESGTFRFYNQKPGFTVSGLLKSYAPQRQTTLELWRAGEAEAAYTSTIPAEKSGSGQCTQEFALKGVEPGTYTLVATKAAHAGFIVHNIVVEDKALDLTDDSRPDVQLMTLRCGDINGDGNINNSDLTILWQQANYNRSAAAADNELCDLNGDGLINNIDLTILWLAYNYNRGEIEVN
jgi:hypothetical protein